MLNCVQIFIIILSFSLYWFKNKQKFKFISRYILYQIDSILLYFILSRFERFDYRKKLFHYIRCKKKIAIRKFEEREIVLNVCRTRAINKRRSFLQARRNLGTNRTNCRALRIYMRWGSTHWSRLVTWHVSREKESKRQDIKDFAIGSNVWRTFLVVGRYGWPVGHASRFAKFRVFMTRSLVAATCQTGTF